MGQALGSVWVPDDDWEWLPFAKQAKGQHLDWGAHSNLESWNKAGPPNQGGCPMPAGILTSLLLS